MRPLFLALFATCVSAQDVDSQAQAILQKNCLICHGAALQSAKLDLRTRESMLTGGERGPAISPGHPEVSRLYLFAAGIEQPSMPPGKKLGSEDLEVLREWIKTGARLSVPATHDIDKATALAKMEDRPILPEERAFWSFQPVKRPDANTIDELWLASLSAKGLAPNPLANKRSLIRRAYLDLVGLPPSPAEVDAFLADGSTDAFSRIVERLLASPHYGERWGRHWLDLVRYSDSAGYEFDRDRPTAHLYRDWVIDALNKDLPYDEFLRLQLAGDQSGKRDAIIAASYLRLGPEPNLKTEQTRMDELDDLLSTTSTVMLGMTVGCARCHNHKFDPIAQKDYYRMQAVFFPGKPADLPLVGPGEIAKHKEALSAWEAQAKPVRDRKAEVERPCRDRLLQAKKDKLADYIKVALATPPDKRTEGQRLNAIQVEKTLRVEEKEVKRVLSQADLAKWSEIDGELKTLDKSKPVLPTALGVEEKKIEPSYFLHHGSVDSKGSRMAPGVLSVAYEGEWPFHETTRRADFAAWVSSPKNPLTARVMVNRIWQHHFGEGIVRTVSNFGKTGERPTHPKLLDWMASEFVRQDWSIKAMHRLIMLSATYQMSTLHDPEAAEIDPENRLLWHVSRRRLEAEAIRDSLLAVGGDLDETIGGSLLSTKNHAYVNNTSAGGELRYAVNRRSIYLPLIRSGLYDVFQAFDFADPSTSNGKRVPTTVAPQALFMMNDPLVLRSSNAMAGRLLALDGLDDRGRIQSAYLTTYGRPPTESEVDRASSYLHRFKEILESDGVEADDRPRRAWQTLCQAIVSSSEFLYID